MDIAARGYANPDLLWSPETLRERLGQSGLAIIDTRPAEIFAKGHIPGARHFDLYCVNTDDTDPAPLASFTRMWADLLGWRGVRESDTIVFSGEFTELLRGPGILVRGISRPWRCACIGRWNSRLVGGRPGGGYRRRPAEARQVRIQPRRENGGDLQQHS